MKRSLQFYCFQKQFGNYCLFLSCSPVPECKDTNISTLLKYPFSPSDIWDIAGVKLSCLHCSPDLSLHLLLVAVLLLETTYYHCHNASAVYKAIRYLSPLINKSHCLILQGQKEERTIDPPFFFFFSAIHLCIYILFQSAVKMLQDVVTKTHNISGQMFYNNECT